jgi:hypothetical protein
MKPAPGDPLGPLARVFQLNPSLPLAVLPVRLA